jgi:membrane associated rhomboid family serine protease
MTTSVEETLVKECSLPDPDPSPPARPLPPMIAFENRLKAVTPYFPVTFVVVAANISAFALMAWSHQRVLHFNTDILIHWGAGYAPKTFAGDWWRPLTSTFLHAGLGHLAGNLFFLLLIAPLIERLLGPTRFAVVYLFAGVGAALVGLGRFPAQPLCGSSGAIYGLYGAFLGCYFRGVRTIPARIFLRSVGLLLLFALVSLMQGYLELETSFVVHLAGFVFGFAGGLLFGHVLGPRKTWDQTLGLSARPAWPKLLVFSLATTLCCGLLFVTASVVRRCSRETVTLLAPYAAALDRERQLVARFTDALERWEDGDVKDTELHAVLNDNIAVWERFRTELKLKLPDDTGLENHPLSVRELLDEAHKPGPHPPKAKEPFTDKEFDLMFRLYLKLRLDNWRALANALKGDNPSLTVALVDEVLIAALRHKLRNGERTEPAGTMAGISKAPTSREEMTQGLFVSAVSGADGKQGVLVRRGTRRETRL